MANYNDGQWHGWNGEKEKPSSVHDNSIIEFIWHDENTNKLGASAMKSGWDVDQEPAWSNIVKFRVIEEHREPREWWILEEGYVCTKEPTSLGWIHVREVLE